MEADKSLTVRQLEITDHGSIVDYFLEADKDFLYGMGVDISKLPSRSEWLSILESDFYLSLNEKKFFYIIWLMDKQPIGHSNINKIKFGQEAYMHLHLWYGKTREKGMGISFLTMTLPYYFETFKLKTLYCEPSAANPGPNKTLEKAGFDFIKTYETTPGWINFHQSVNRWSLAFEKFKVLNQYKL